MFRLLLEHLAGRSASPAEETSLLPIPRDSQQATIAPVLRELSVNKLSLAQMWKSSRKWVAFPAEAAQQSLVLW